MPSEVMPPTSAPDLCRFCGAQLHEVFVDLGPSPLANSFLRPERLRESEPFYPLQALVCGACFLVQLPAWASPASLFAEYAYFASFSDTGLEHARQYVEQIVRRHPLGPASLVVEIGSNDGYLLRNFKGRNIPFLGIDFSSLPAA